MKRIALINPPTPDGNFVPPLGLLTIAAVLEKQGYEPAVFDANGNPAAKSSIQDFKPDLIGLTAVTSAILSAKKLAGELRTLLPGVPITFGGPHPTAMPLEVISWPEVDYVITGEGEVAMLGLMEWISAKGSLAELSKIPNLYHKNAGLPQFTYRDEFLSSKILRELPLPAYHLLDVETVVKKLRHGLFRKGKRALPYMASRGCPHQCAFCCQMMGRRVRRKSPEQVIDEIEHLVELPIISTRYI
ncbi:MAG: radical SAM protein [Solidesulfovibrio sp.]